MLRITLVLFIVGGALAQIDSKLRCPTLQTVGNFSLTAFSGRWYEFERYNNKSRIMNKCVTDAYIPYDHGSFLIMRLETSMGKTYINGYKATPVGDPREGKFKLASGEPYDVLGTDYVNWALTWTCVNTKTGSTRDARILTREINPSKLVINFAEAVVKVKNIHRDRFIHTIKTGCPAAYYKHGN